MKTTRIAVNVLAMSLICYAMTSCVTTTTTMPDGTVIKSSGPAPGSIEAATAIAEIIAEK